MPINKIIPVSIALEEDEKSSDLEDDFIEDISLTTQGETSNSQLIHPEVTNVTGSYKTQPKMTTSFEPQYFHRKSSSMNDLQHEKDFANSTFSTTNLGLTYVLNERNIQGGSTLSLMSSRVDSMSDIGSISSLTPSIINRFFQEPNFHVYILSCTGMVKFLVGHVNLIVYPNCYSNSF